MNSKKLSLLQAVLLLLFLSLSVVILYFAKPFLVPLVLAGVLAMLLLKMATKFERKGMKRGLAALFAVLLLLLAFVVIAALVGWQLSGFTENMGELKRHGLSMLEKLRNWLDGYLGIDRQQQEELMSTEGSSSGAGDMLLSFATGLFSMAVDTILVLVYVFLFLLLRRRIKNFILLLVNEQYRDNATDILHKSSSVSQQYLEGLSKMIVLLWIMYGIGFTAVGVENALFFAILCGLLEIVPFVGNLLGTSFTVLAVAAQGGSTDMILGVVAVYMVVQFVQTYVLEPLVVGSQVRINPLFTIIALVAGELLWGIAGMVLAIPLMGVLRIIFDHIPTLKPYAYLIGSESSNRPSLWDKVKSWFKQKTSQDHKG